MPRKRQTYPNTMVASPAKADSAVATVPSSAQPNPVAPPAAKTAVKPVTDKQIAIYADLVTGLAKRCDLNKLLNVRTNEKGEPQFVSIRQAGVVIHKAVMIAKIIRSDTRLDLVSSPNNAAAKAVAENAPVAAAA